MSAPDTDLKKQERRHWPSLIGMALGVIFALGLLALLLIWLAAEGDEPGAAPVDAEAAAAVEAES